MSGSILNPICVNHPGRSAVTSCAYCDKPVCESCRTELVAAERTFCSERCRDALPGAGGQDPVGNEVLAAGLAKPIRVGWALWARSMGRITAHGVPLAAFVGLAVWALNRPWTAFEPAMVALILFCSTFGAALTGVILSARHTRLVAGNPIGATARRYVPWVVTWLLMTGITLAGYLALLLPGIYLSLRLFWADEFALVHGKGPIAALRASWEVTRNQAGVVFLFQFMLGLAQYVMLVPFMIVLVVMLAGIEGLGLADPATSSGLVAFLLYLTGMNFYGSIHGPEIVQFYGMRAALANPGATVRKTRVVPVAAAVILVGVSMIGVIAAIAIPNLIHAVDRSKQKKAMADMRSLAAAIESYAVDNDRYPRASSIAEVESLLVPDHRLAIPRIDGWGEPFEVSSSPTGYEIRSAGKDRVFESDPPRGATFEFREDIVLRDGEFVQAPLGLAPAAPPGSIPGD